MDFITLLGLSFLAAFGGTTILTIGQEIEVLINKRPVSFVPAIAVFKILHFDFERLNVSSKVFVNYIAHFSYGTFWGFPLVLLYFYNFTNFFQTVFVFYFIVLIQGWIIMWILGVARPPWMWSRREILGEILHKMVYALVTVYVFFLFI